MSPALNQLRARNQTSGEKPYLLNLAGLIQPRSLSSKDSKGKKKKKGNGQRQENALPAYRYRWLAVGKDFFKRKKGVVERRGEIRLRRGQLLSSSGPSVLPLFFLSA